MKVMERLHTQKLLLVILGALVSPSVFGQPANDACSGAVAMTAETVYAVNTANATSTGDPTPPCLSLFGKGVWYTFTPSVTRVVTISTCGSGFDTVVAVYTGACTSLSPVS